MGSHRRCRVLRPQQAYTLLEMLLAVLIVGVLMALVLPAYSSYQERALVGIAMADLKQIESSLDKYYTFNYVYPSSLSEIGVEIVDPWGNPYHYLRMSDFNDKGQPVEKGNKGGGKPDPKAKVRKDRNLHPINTDYDLYSLGADGKSVAPLTAQPSRDDIIRASNGAFVGLAVDY